MQALLVATGTRGDVQPMLVLGLRLRARGHEVRVATHASAEGLVRGAGLPHLLLAGRPMELLRSEDAQALLATSSVHKAVDIWADELRRVEDAWWSALEGPAQQADVVVSGLLSCVVPSEAAAAAGRPHAIVLPFPCEPAWLETADRLFGPVVERTFLEPQRAFLERRRRERGRAVRERSTLEALRAEGAHLLRTWSPALYPAPKHEEAPLGVVLPTADEASRLGLPEVCDETERWLDAGDPPLFVGFGSMPVPDEAAFATTLEAALGELDLRAVVQGVALEHLDPKRVHHVGPCDHAALLPRCTVAIHHGGAGTTHAVARAGVPEVVCPVLNDQFLWARRAAALGVGEALPARRLRPASLREALRRALDPDVIERARELARTLAGEDGAEATVAQIEGLAA